MTPPPQDQCSLHPRDQSSPPNGNPHCNSVWSTDFKLVYLPIYYICWLPRMFARYAGSNFKKHTFSKAPTEGGGSAKNRIWFHNPCPENKAKQWGTVNWAEILLCVVAISQVFGSCGKKLLLIKKLESNKFSFFLKKKNNLLPFPSNFVFQKYGSYFGPKWFRK